MNKERYNQIIDEAYENYTQTKVVGDAHISPRGHYTNETKEEFINKCKTEPSFSETYGLKIEERELSLEERNNIWFNNNYETGMERFFDPNELPDFDNSYYEPTPTKVVTVTYKEEKIKVYE
jgi:hypothetical protein